MDMKPDGEATVSPPTIPQAPEVTGKLEYVMMTNSDTPGSGFGMVIPTISSTPPASHAVLTLSTTRERLDSPETKTSPKQSVIVQAQLLHPTSGSKQKPRLLNLRTTYRKSAINTTKPGRTTKRPNKTEKLYDAYNRMERKYGGKVKMMEDIPSEYSEGMEQSGECKCSVGLISHHATTCVGSTHKKSSHEQTTHNWDRPSHDKPMCDVFPVNNPSAPEEPSHTHHHEMDLHTKPAGPPKAQCVNTVHEPIPLPSFSKATGLSDLGDQ